MDCSLPGFFVHGISQARILEWVAIPFSRGPSWPGHWTYITCIADSLLSEPLGKPVKVKFILFCLNIQFSRHHLLNKLPFLHLVFLATLSNISWLYMPGLISGLLILFHRPICVLILIIPFISWWELEMGDWRIFVCCVRWKRNKMKYSYVLKRKTCECVWLHNLTFER